MSSPITAGDGSSCAGFSDQTYQQGSQEVGASSSTNWNTAHRSLARRLLTALPTAHTSSKVIQPALWRRSSSMDTLPRFRAIR